MHFAQWLFIGSYPCKDAKNQPRKRQRMESWVCSLCLAFLVRSDKDTRQWIPHLTATSAAGPGTQLQLACRPPSSRPVQKDSREEGPAVPRLPWLPPDLSWSLPKSHSPCFPEPRDRVPPSKVAKAAFLWTTQEMYVRRLSLSVLKRPSLGSLGGSWVWQVSEAVLNLFSDAASSQDWWTPCWRGTLLGSVRKDGDMGPFWPFFFFSISYF